jgi:hypothetical protein
VTLNPSQSPLLSADFARKAAPSATTINQRATVNKIVFFIVYRGAGWQSAQHVSHSGFEEIPLAEARRSS